MRYVCRLCLLVEHTLALTCPLSLLIHINVVHRSALLPAPALMYLGRLSELPVDGYCVDVQVLRMHAQYA